MTDIFERVTLRQLQIFLAVVEHRSFWRVAVPMVKPGMVAMVWIHRSNRRISADFALRPVCRRGIRGHL